MLASVELKKRENRDDLDFLQMKVTYLVVYIWYLGKKKYQKQVPVLPGPGQS